MITAVLVVGGLCIGSFINAFVWRLHEQSLEKQKRSPNQGRLNKLSILNGRSLCPDCGHQLDVIDLVPVISWLSLRGKCRYCHKPISMQYPIVELLTPLLFVVSYLDWPQAFDKTQYFLFALWLILTTGFIILALYDLRYRLLPNRIIYPLAVVGIIFAAILIVNSDNQWVALLDTLLSIAVGGGFFYILFVLSSGRWIGGGDVRLGWLLGLVVGTPARAALLLFLAALIGTVVSLPYLYLNRRLKHGATIPFGPFLLVAVVIVQLYGHSIIHWYQSLYGVTG